MRKRIAGRRLKRDTNERKALFRNLMASVVLYGKIKTTESKAKSVKADVERLITIGKKGDENARRAIMQRVPDARVADKILKEIAPKFATRAGGYTRIIKVGPRVKDGARIVVLTFVEEVKPTSFAEVKRNTDKKASTTKKAEVKVEKNAKKEEKKPAKSKTK
jgi:large subunit ribosomal protein L17